jgi:hypothetical protein
MKEKLENLTGRTANVLPLVIVFTHDRTANVLPLVIVFTHDYERHEEQRNGTSKRQRHLEDQVERRIRA